MSRQTSPRKSTATPPARTRDRVLDGIFSDIYSKLQWILSGEAIERSIIARVAKLAAQPGSLIKLSARNLQGVLISNQLQADAQRYGTTGIAFTPFDYNTVEWTSGTLLLASGKSYSITAGSTGEMTAATYVYWDEATPTVLQMTTTPADAVGAGKILLCYCEPAGTTSSKAQAIPGVGKLGLNGDNLAPNSIKTDHVQANSITSAEIDVADLFAITITVSSTGSIESSDYVAGSSGWIIHGNGSAELQNATIRGTLNASDLEAGTIDLDLIELVSDTGDNKVKISGTEVIAYGLSTDGVTTQTSRLGEGYVKSGIYAATNFDETRLTPHAVEIYSVQPYGSDPDIKLNASGIVTAGGLGYYDLDGNRIITVIDEGAGNGFDADMVDGQHASAFSTRTHSELAGSTPPPASDYNPGDTLYMTGSSILYMQAAGGWKQIN